MDVGGGSALGRTMAEATNKKRIMALVSLRRRAERGDLEALATLGHVLATGELGKPDPAGAFVALSRAAAAGHAGARADLAALERTMGPADRATAEARLNAPDA